MSMLDLRTASFNDIVFEGRNKLYGAYVLRQLYERHLVRALAIAVSLTLLLVVSPLVKTWLFPAMIVVPAPTPDLPFTKLIEPPIFEKVEPAASQPQAARPVVHPPAVTVPKVVPNDQVKPDDKPVAPVVTDLTPSAIETTGPVGPATGKGDGTVGATGNGKSDTAGKAPVAAGPGWVLAPEVMPEFVGGPAALQRYMQKNLRYPSLALRNNIDGRVYISFTVQADGSIADVQVIKGLGFGTDEEAARVVKNMPAWKPGMQNKHSVPVRYTMPITFRYE